MRNFIKFRKHSRRRHSQNNKKFILTFHHTTPDNLITQRPSAQGAGSYLFPACWGPWWRPEGTRPRPAPCRSRRRASPPPPGTAAGAATAPTCPAVKHCKIVLLQDSQRRNTVPFFLPRTVSVVCCASSLTCLFCRP